MTDLQKQSVLEMRRDGMGITQTASTLGLSVNTVKAFLRRTKQKKDSEEKPLKCKECGKTLVRINGAKHKKYCDDVCRFDWWKSHHDAVSRENMTARSCHHCGKDFEAYEKTNQKYCSHSCYIEARFGKGGENDQ